MAAGPRPEGWTARDADRAGYRTFARELAERAPDPEGRRWLFVPEDQLSEEIGPLSREDPRALGIVLIESGWKASRRPYHKQKLALVIANLRQFALEQAERGVDVRYVITDEPYRSVLDTVAAETGTMTMMEPAERELRADLGALIQLGRLHVLPHEGWLTTSEQFLQGAGERPPWRMDGFYRRVRRETGLLMKGDKPVGGKFSFDVENRKAWPGEPHAPRVPTFSADAISEEVGELIAQRFAHHPGEVDLATVPSTRRDAEALWRWAKKHCLPLFGPFEDAMSRESRNLFHTRISGLVNLHRLLPRQVVHDAADLDIPLASKEGFIRQVLGWREFVRHVHVHTDGFRRLPDMKPRTVARPGDGGYRSWAGRAWKSVRRRGDPDGGASPSFLNSRRGLPPAYWGTPSGLSCLDHVVADVWAEGYSHHITRLMVLSNLATLLDLSPRDLTDWFWVAYTDAHDWVVEPNVIGMGTFAAGDLMTTKPYVSGAAYINRMSDYCGSCAFKPDQNCPITSLYWAFLDRHYHELKDNPRLRLPLQSLRRRSALQCGRDARVFATVSATLKAGRLLTPDLLNKPATAKNKK